MGGNASAFFEPSSTKVSSSDTKIIEELQKRTIKEEHLFPTTFGSARLKLRMAQRLEGELCYSFDIASGISEKERGTKGWDRKKCVKFLKEAGFETPEIAFDRFTLSTFESRHAQAEEAIKQCERLANKISNKNFISDMAAAANTQASLLLAELTPFALWHQSKKGSFTTHRGEFEDAESTARDYSSFSHYDSVMHFSYFSELLDAHSYLAYANMSNLYNSCANINGKEEYISKTNGTLDNLYSELLPSSSKNSSPEEYGKNLVKFYSAYSKFSQKQTENFLREKEIHESSGFQRFYALSEPYAAAAVPIVMAAVMATPGGMPAGTLYFANSAKDSFKEGRILEGALISATLMAPFFGALRTSSGVLTKAGKIGLSASHTAGTIFQIQIAGSTASLLLDVAKYGMSAQDIAQLGQNIGFLGMPLAEEKATKGNLSKETEQNIQGPLKELVPVLKSVPVLKQGIGKIKDWILIARALKKTGNLNSKDIGHLIELSDTAPLARKALLKLSRDKGWFFTRMHADPLANAAIKHPEIAEVLANLSFRRNHLRPDYQRALLKAMKTNKNTVFFAAEKIFRHKNDIVSLKSEIMDAIFSLSLNYEPLKNLPEKMRNDIFTSWLSHKGNYIEINLAQITVLEIQKRGLWIELYEKFGIRNPGRYNTEDLIRQYSNMDAQNSSKPLLLVLFSIADHNGSLFNDSEIIHSLQKDFDVRIVEAGSRKEAISRIAEISRKYGKISTLLVGGHGSEYRIEFGYEAGGTMNFNDLLTESKNKPGRLGKYFIEYPSAILVSCSTGAKGGIADKTLGIHPTAKFYAPEIPTFLKNVKFLGLDKNKTPLFEVEWADKEAGAFYSSDTQEKKEE